MIISPLPFGPQHQKGIFTLFFFLKVGVEGHCPLQQEASSTTRIIATSIPTLAGPEVSLKCKSGHKAYLAEMPNLGLGGKNFPFSLGPALQWVLEPDMRVVLGYQERPKTEPIITNARGQAATAGALRWA